MTATVAPCWDFRHGADIGVRGLGPTLASAFEQAVLALTAVVSDPASIRPDATVRITAAASNPELLLYK